MSNEVVKYDLKNRIARWRENAAPMLPPASAPPAPSLPRHTEATTIWAPPATPPLLNPGNVLIETPRICAKEKKLWTALYWRKAGAKYFEYLRSNIAESWRISRYATPEKWRSLPPNLRLGVELCPHCGSYTMDGAVGAVWCDRCRQFVCYGLTSQQGYFICQCGREGQLVNGMPRGSGIA